MFMKVMGAAVGIFGMALLLFAVMAFRELSQAATSDSPPSPDSMPLTHIVGPELFTPGKAAASPAALAATAMKRICAIGGGGVLLGIVGAVVFANAPSRHETVE